MYVNFKRLLFYIGGIQFVASAWGNVSMRVDQLMLLNCCRQLQRGAETVPEEIQTMWAKAVSSNCRAAKTALFQKWLLAGGDYAMLPGCMQYRSI